MERDKQIEERGDLALIVDYAIRDWQDYRDACHEDGLDVSESMAESIAAAVLANGYRKQSEGEWIDKATGAYCRMQSWCSACGKHSGIGGIESNRHKPFCPNCGSKMKGADDEQRED
jgi:cation transport regulator ChaB